VIELPAPRGSRQRFERRTKDLRAELIADLSAFEIHGIGAMPYSRHLEEGARKLARKLAELNFGYLGAARAYGP
jgi:hypothetical protein